VGQAKKRGSRETRIAQAQARQRNEEPINVACKTCGEVLNGFTFLQHLPSGAAWQKTCTCGAVTTALVQAKDSTLQRTFRSTLAMAEEITGQAREKVSVSFIEKNLDTVETGLIRFG